MSDNLAIIIPAASAAVVILLLVVARLVKSNGRRNGARLDDLHQGSGIFDVDVSLRARRPKGWGERFDQRFDAMIHGTKLDITREEALGMIGLSGATLATVCYFWKGYLWLVFGGLVLGLAIPLLAFYIMSGRYRRELRDQLPDMFYLLARSLRAGLSLPQALHEAQTQGVKPLADELATVNASVRLGLPIADALERIAENVQVADFDAFVSAVALYQTTGGDLALVLDRLANGARDRSQFRRQFYANTARGRVTAIIIGMSVPLLLLIFSMTDPDRFTRFVSSSYGLSLLCIALALQVVGCVWIYRLLNIKY